MRNPATWVAVVRIVINKLCCWCWVERPVEWRSARVICLGLDGAGKTTVCSCVEGKPSLEQAPTSGFNCRNADIRPHWRLDLWDLGGNELIRQFWPRYLTADTMLIVFVVDACDATRFDEAREALSPVLEALPGVPLMIIANKQDVEDAATAEAVGAALGVEELKAARACAVLPLSCADVANAAGTASTLLSDVVARIRMSLEGVER